MSRTSESFEKYLNKKFWSFDGLIMVKKVVRIPLKKKQK
jgi:hypothetical protein